MAAVRQFFDERVFGAERIALMAAALPKTAAADTARRTARADGLRKRLRKIDAAENAHAREIEALAGVDAGSPAVTALRTRIIARFGELEADRAAITAELADLTAADTAARRRSRPARQDPRPARHPGRCPAQPPDQAVRGL